MTQSLKDLGEERHAGPLLRPGSARGTGSHPAAAVLGKNLLAAHRDLIESVVIVVHPVLEQLGESRKAHLQPGVYRGSIEGLSRVYRGSIEGLLRVY